jgi:hypothetical protein
MLGRRSSGALAYVMSMNDFDTIHSTDELPLKCTTGQGCFRICEIELQLVDVDSNY